MFQSVEFKLLHSLAALFLSMLLSTDVLLLVYGYPEKSLVVSTGLLIFLVYAFVLRAIDKKRDNIRLNFYVLSSALACTYGFAVYLETEKSLLWLMLYVLCAVFLHKGLGREAGKHTRILSLLLGLLFALFLFVGFQLEEFGRLEVMHRADDLSNLFVQLSYFAGQALLLFSVLSEFFTVMREKSFSEGDDDKLLIKNGLLRVLIIAAGIILLWMPYFIAYYPGNLSYDSFYEIRQQMGIQPLSNHHPYLHQLFIALCLKFASGNLEYTALIYSCVQMCFMALCFATCIVFLGKMKVSKFVRTAVFLFYGLFLVHPFYATTIWKDVPFAAVALLLMMAMIWEHSSLNKVKPWFYAVMVGLCFLFCLLRSNGWYSFLLGFPLYILCNRDRWKKLTAVFAAVLLLVSGYNRILYDVVGAEKPSVGEALSIPLQQIARTVKNDPQALEHKDVAVLKELFTDYKALPERYMSGLSDDVKAEGMFLPEVFEEDPLKYVKSWVRLGLKHPKDYIDATLMQNYGYWYPDVSYWIVCDTIYPNEFELVQSPKMEELRRSIATLIVMITEMKPISIIFSLALMVWLMMISAGLLCLKGKGGLASPMILLGGVWLTTLASPVYCEYRYLYSIVVCVPLFLAMASGVKGKENP